MDPAQAASQVLTNEIVIGVVLLVFTAAGTMLILFIRGGFKDIKDAIGDLKDSFDGHVEDDKRLTERVNNHSQRLAKLDKESE